MTGPDLNALPESESAMTAVPATAASSPLTREDAQTAGPASTSPADRVFWHWPAEREAELLRLHEEGRGPTEIAGLMGLSKNSICGKLKRLGLAVPRPARRKAPPSRPRVRSVAGLRPARPRRARPEPARASIAGPVNIWALEPSSCRWPLFEGHDPVAAQFYCGDEAVRGKSYCLAHCARSMGGHG